MMRRSTFAAAMAAGVAVPAIARAQNAKKAFTLGTAPNEDAIGAVWAVETGAFARAGLDVTIQKANSGSAVAAAVAGHALDVGKSNFFSLVRARAKGLPFVIIAPAAVYDFAKPAVSLVVATNSPLRNGADLNGKLMGTPGLEDQTVLGTRAWMDKHGGDSTTLQFVEMPESAIVPSITARRIDMGVLEQPLLSYATGNGSVRVLCNPFDVIALHFVWAAYFTTTEFVAANPELIRAFKRTLFDSATYVNAHHEETAEALARFTGIDAKLIASMPRTVIGTSLTPAMLQPVIDLAAAYKAIPKDFAAATMMA